MTMLAPEPHVPHVRGAEVLGVDGSKAWGLVHDGLPTVALVVQDRDRCNMARLELDGAGCEAVALMLAEMAQALQAAGSLESALQAPG